MSILVIIISLGLLQRLQKCRRKSHRIIKQKNKVSKQQILTVVVNLFSPSAPFQRCL